MTDSLITLLTLVKQEYKHKGIGPIYTGEKDVIMNSEELKEALEINPLHKKYLEVMNAKEQGINLATNDLMSVVFIDDKIYTLIPDWDMFITALDIYTRLTKFIEG